MTFRLAPLVLLLVALGGCKEGLVEPERFGDIDGAVLDFASGAALPNALVTTSPATESIQVGADGQFRIEDVLTGTYTIRAARAGYEPNTVTVQVRDGRVTQAIVVLNREEEETPAEAALETEVLRFQQTTVGTDSSFVTVDYRVRNTGAVPIAAYELYFRVDTAEGVSFFEEVGGEDLQPGERDISTYHEQLNGARAVDVVIEDTNARTG